MFKDTLFMFEKITSTCWHTDLSLAGMECDNLHFALIICSNLLIGTYERKNAINKVHIAIQQDL